MPYFLLGDEERFIEAYISTLKDEGVNKRNNLFTKDGEVRAVFAANTPDPDFTFKDNPNANVDANAYNLISGVYTVLTVEHNFNNGSFTQKLDMIRDNTIDIGDEETRIALSDQSLIGRIKK